MSTPAQLKARFAYMFSGPLEDDGIAFQRGWMPIVERLCQDIDTLLGEDKQGFHWTQIGYGYRDEFDRLQLRFNVAGMADVYFAIRYLIRQASDATTKTCVCCGQPGWIRTSVSDAIGEILTLCDDHSQELLTRGLEGVGGRAWFEMAMSGHELGDEK